jgi:nucleoside 2-deoxyribosyltransferase
MRRIASIYLSTPGVGPAGGSRLAEKKRALCRAAGFRGLTGFDETLIETQPSEVMAREIYTARVARMRRADAAVVDLTPRLGPCCDQGVAFEAGFMAALGKPVFAYLNVTSPDEVELRARLEDFFGDCGDQAEDFGLPENLMLWAEARRTFIVVTPDIESDLTGFELCLEAAQLYAA